MMRICDSTRNARKMTNPVWPMTARYTRDADRDRQAGDRHLAHRRATQDAFERGLREVTAVERQQRRRG